MSMIRLQNSTPSEYCAQSRDFQLLCRLYDTIFNNLQFDISTITSILNTKKCRDTILPLLQTKVGFFTNKETDNVSLRYFLEVFPLLVKNKGTEQAIRQAVITFLKINNVLSPVTIYYTIEEIVLANNYTVPDHTILIGINCSFLDTTLLEEVLKYILPAGIGYYFYFYTDISTIDKVEYKDKAVILYTSPNINSQIRGNTPVYPKDEENRLLNAVDTTLIISTDSFLPGQGLNLFLGIYFGEDSFDDFIYNFESTYNQETGRWFIDGNLIMYNRKLYIFGILGNGDWVEISYFGTVAAIMDRDNYSIPPSKGELVYVADEEIYYLFDGNNWTLCGTADDNAIVFILFNFVEGEES